MQRPFLDHMWPRGAACACWPQQPKGARVHVIMPDKDAAVREKKVMGDREEGHSEMRKSK